MRQNWLEWAILAVSIAVVVMLVGYLAVAGLSGSRPAQVSAEADPAAATAGPYGGWLLPVTVRNGGGIAAMTVILEGTASVAGIDEVSEITVDVLAAESEVEVVLGFSGEPAGEVELRIVGFEIP
jgi:uncharacterized protein (TIGR02588 family)